MYGGEVSNAHHFSPLKYELGSKVALFGLERDPPKVSGAQEMAVTAEFLTTIQGDSLWFVVRALRASLSLRPYCTRLLLTDAHYLHCLLVRLLLVRHILL